jgi:hypothetical protein
VGAVELRHPEAIREGPRQTDLLVDLDDGAGAHQPHLGMGLVDPRLGLVGRGAHDDHGMVVPPAHLRLPAELLRRVARERVPVVPDVGVMQRQLGITRRCRPAVERDARRVGPAIVHLEQHGRQMRPQARLNVVGLGEEPHDPTHGDESP